MCLTVINATEKNRFCKGNGAWQRNNFCRE